MDKSPKHGRPTRYPDGAMAARISLTLPRKTYERLEKAARASGDSVAEVVRRIIVKHEEVASAPQS